MANPKIHSTHRLFDPAREILEAGFDVDYWTGAERPSRAEFLRNVKGKDGLVCLLTEKINDEVLALAPKLRIVANVAVGFDNVDVPACTRRGVAVTNTPGVLDETTADFAWTLLMAVARRVAEGEHLVRSGNWKGWDLDQLCGTDVWGKTLGIVGFGRIGRRVGTIAHAFGMAVVAADPLANFEPEYQPFTRADIPAVFAAADVVSLHCPLTDGNAYFVDRKLLSCMKASAFFINTARGQLVDEQALAEALHAGRLAGAGLDVLAVEPMRPDNPLLHAPNCIITPHLAWASLAARRRLMAATVANVEAFLSGRPTNVVN